MPEFEHIDYDGPRISVRHPPCPHKSMTQGSSTGYKLVCDDCHEELDPKKELKSFDNDCCNCDCHN